MAVRQGVGKAMRIPIRTKLASVYLVVFFFMFAIVLFALQKYKGIYIDEIGRSSTLLAEEMFKRMDQRLFHLVVQFKIQAKAVPFQKFLSDSNNSFSRFPNVVHYIHKQNKDWISANISRMTPFMEGLRNNRVSRFLDETFHDRFLQQYGYALIRKIVVTNAYGANIALSARTYDYDQSGKIWWQSARDRGLFVSDIGDDGHAAKDEINLAIRINDEAGDFAGVLSARLDVKNMIREAEVGTRKYGTTQVQIITNTGRLIYSTTPHRFLDDVRETSLFRQLEKSKGYFIADGTEPLIVSHASSKGFKYFNGFDWFLVISHQLDEVLKPYFTLQKQFIMVAGGGFFFIIVLVFVIGKQILSPLSALTNAVTRIGEGKPYRPVDLKGDDEFSDLAAAFNTMLEKRRRAEEALEERERLLNEVGRIAKIGGWEMDLISRKAKWTRGTYAIVEIDCDRPVPGPDEHIAYYLPEYRSLVSDAMEALVEKDRPLDFEAQLQTPKGHIKWCRALGHGVRKNGRCIKVYGTFQDITDRKRAELEILELNRDLELRVRQRTLQLEEANKELEDFVYSVSHDLRAPLRSISGFAQIIDRRHRASLNEEAGHYFDNIIKASGQMGALIDDLLNFSRLGRKGVKSGTVSLDRVFERVMETLSAKVQETDARIHMPGHMPTFQGDLTLATHVFINLLENALKYRKPDEPPRINVGIEMESNSFWVSVADNGIGIPPEYHEKIFNIFQRLHSDADYPGTGIGLAAVKKAVQIMGGGIRVESEPGKGSIFWIRLLRQ